MRRGFLLLALAVAATPAPAAAQSGGAVAPSGNGGVQPGQPVKPVARKPRVSKRLTVGAFTVSPPVIQPGGAPTQFTYRIDGRGRSVRVRIDLVSSGRVRKRLQLGYKRLGETYTRTWRPLGGELPAGSYTARLHVSGRRLVRTATASGRSALEVRSAPVVVGTGVFPIQGAYTWGDGFGVDRGDHMHQGQDLMAEEGTPLVSPRSGTVYWNKFQEGGAGHYVVVRADDGRDYVFMHLREASPLKVEDRVAAGGVVGYVGSTGRSSAPHLHFEIWPGGWYGKDSAPIDPRPDLEAWAAGGA